jgi:hypothetical protein
VPLRHEGGHHHHQIQESAQCENVRRLRPSASADRKKNKSSVAHPERNRQQWRPAGFSDEDDGASDNDLQRNSANKLSASAGGEKRGKGDRLTAEIPSQDMAGHTGGPLVNSEVQAAGEKEASSQAGEQRDHDRGKPHGHLQGSNLGSGRQEVTLAVGGTRPLGGTWRDAGRARGGGSYAVANLSRSELSSIQQVASPEGAAGPENRLDLSPASESDSSGSMRFKLRRKQLLWQKICDRVGCSFDEAKLTLAEVDIERRGPNPEHIYRGDGWRLTRVCELVTQRAVALKEEQRAKWTQEVKLATGCTTPMASLAVNVAEREPSLVRNGKLSAPHLVAWATRWVQDRRAKKQSVEGYYEESFVAQLQRDKAMKNRRESGPEADGGLPPPPRKEALRLTKGAVEVLVKAHNREFEVLPPLNPADQAVREMVAELLLVTQHTHGADAELEPLTSHRALCALEASRYLPGVGNGWPTVELALGCLERGGNRELWEWQAAQIAKRAGVDLSTAQRARQDAVQQGAGAYSGEEVVEVGVKLLRGDEQAGKRAREGTEKGQLGLTRTAIQMLERDEDELSRRPALNLEEGRVSEMVYELMEAVGGVYGDEVEPIELRTAVDALEASRHIPGERGLASVKGALMCLENREGKELWQLEVERIAKQAGVSPMSAREARNQVMKTHRKGEVEDIVRAGVQWLREHQEPAGDQLAKKNIDSGCGRGSSEQAQGRGHQQLEGRGGGGDQPGQQGPAGDQLEQGRDAGGGRESSNERGQGRGLQPRLENRGSASGGERDGENQQQEGHDGSGRKPEQQRPADGPPQEHETNRGGGGGCDDRRKRFGRQDDSSDDEGGGLGRGGSGCNPRQAKGGAMPPLNLLGGVSGLCNRAAQSTEAEEQRAKGKKRTDPETESAAKRQRTTEPLSRSLKRALSAAEKKRRKKAESSASDSDDRLSGLDSRHRRKVLGRGRDAQERELARHTVKSKVAETARIGRQEDMHYALDQYRRQQQGEQLTPIEREWAALGATLSPAKVLGYGAGNSAEEEVEDQPDEFDSLVDAIMEQYDCEEEEAVEALETTADEQGWDVDAAIDYLLELGVQAYEREEEREDGTDAGKGSCSPPPTESANRADITDQRWGDHPAGRTGRGDPRQEKNKISVLGGYGGVREGNQVKPLQLRYRARSEDPRAREVDHPSEDNRAKRAEQVTGSPRRITAAGGIRDLKGYELLVRQLQRTIGCDDTEARLLLMDKRARADSGGGPDVAKAVKLFYEGRTSEGKGPTANPGAVEPEITKLRTAAGTLHSMVLPSLTLPDWDVGKAPEGGFTYPTFRRISALFQKYQRQTNFATTVTLKSLVTAQLRPTIEARCGFTKTAWKELNEGGMDDAEFIRRVQDTLKPVRAMEFEVLFEGMKLKHPGNETDILATVEEWGEKWLSTEREAEEQGIHLQAGKMKELFKKAVAPISRVSRLILGEPYKSTAEWYTLIIRELRLRQSYAAEADRDGKKRVESFFVGSPRGGRGVGRGRFFGNRQDHQNSGTNSPAEGNATFNNHSGGAEPMVYQPAGRGRGRGVSSPRGRGGQWAGRGGREYGQEGRQAQPSGRGDAGGASHNAGQWGNRQPINNPDHESATALSCGKWWHDSSQANLCCRAPDCGTKQEIPFCQGCGQHHHGREWCYKKNEDGFNATGYWSENRKGRAPLPSREGRPYGAPPARHNHMDADGTGNSGQGLA